MTTGDTRKVQTAVVGTARSRDPVQMPEARFEAVLFRAEYAHRRFWCGVWLGGCGKRLTTRVGKVRVPHFAHYPEFPERHVCLRKHTDAASADHLYLARDLEHWLVAHGQENPVVDLRGDFAAGETCRQAVLTTRQGDLSVEFMPELGEEQGGHAWRTRLFGPGATPPRELVERQRYALRARLGTGEGRYRTEIGTMTPMGDVHWTALQECVLSDRGLTTPHMPPPVQTETVVERTAEVFGLPLDPRDLLTYPQGKHSSDRHGASSPGHPHRLAVYFLGHQQEQRAGHLWLPGPVSDLGIGQPHLINGPAWADLDRSTPERWSVRAQGITALRSVPKVLRAKATSASEKRKIPGVPEPNQFPDRADQVVEESHVRLVDPGPTLDTPDLPETLMIWLEEAGWSVRGNRSARRWLTLALMHRSRVYESPGVPNGYSDLLGVLASLGSRWLAVNLMDVFVRELVPSGVGDQSAWLAAVQESVLRQMREWPQISDHLLLSKGEEGTGGRTKRTVRSQAVLQLLGVMALHGCHVTLATLVNRAYRQSEIREGGSQGLEWVYLLDRELGTGTYDVRYRKHGPDHSATFHSTIVDKAGRSTTGEGGSKAEAKTRAAQAFLERYLPAVASARGRQSVERRVPGTEPLLPRVYRDLPDGHRRLVERLRTTFSLPPSARGWIVQALTHASWAYENRAKVLSYAQKDNTLLAHHGSFVGQLIHAHLQVAELLGKTLELTSEEARVSTPESVMWQELSHRIGASEGILTSGGAKAPGKSVQADVMQALLAVFWREHGAATLDLLPEDITRALREQRTGLDPLTLLQRHFSWFGVDYELRHRQSGPDHLRAYEAEVSFGAAAERISVLGPVVPGAKRSASKAVAQDVLDVVDRIGNMGEWDLDEEQLPVARALLTAQIAGSREVRGKKLLSCTKDGHLGLGYLKDRDIPAFAAWAERVEAVLGRVGSERLVGLMDLYERAARASTGKGSPRLRTALRTLAERVADVLSGGTVTDEDRQLTGALNGYRYIGSQSATTVGEQREIILVSGDEESRNRILYGPPRSDAHLGVSRREASCLAMLTRLLCEGHEGTSAEVAQNDSGALVIVTRAEGPPPVEATTLAELLGEVVPTLTADLTERECVIEVTPADKVDSLIQAGAWAMRGSFGLPPGFDRVLALVEELFGADEGDGRRLNDEELRELKRGLAHMV